MRWCVLAFLSAMVLIAGCGGSGGAPASKPVRPFFAMDTGTKDAEHPSAKSQAMMLKELGYAGIGGTGTAGITEMLAALDENGLGLYALYMNLRLEAEQAVFDPDPTSILAQLQGRHTIIWFQTSPGPFRPSGTEADELLIAAMRDLADKARPFGVKLAIYPHYGCYVQKVDDALRLAKKADRDNVGISFNLCHWLRGEPDADLEAAIQFALPYLQVVSINGADVDTDNWGRLIQPLGRGTFDVRQLLDVLDKHQWAGPVGLQGYGIP